MSRKVGRARSRSRVFSSILPSGSQLSDASIFRAPTTTVSANSPKKKRIARCYFCENVFRNIFYIYRTHYRPNAKMSHNKWITASPRVRDANAKIMHFPRSTAKYRHYLASHKVKFIPLCHSLYFIIRPVNRRNNIKSPMVTAEEIRGLRALR